MPLKKGYSEKSVEKNISTEMHHGKKMEQAVAISLAIAEKAREKAHKEGQKNKK